MNIEKIMMHDPLTVHKTDNLRVALLTFEQAEHSYLPVLGSSRHLVGVLSRNDCLRALKLPQDMPVSAWGSQRALDQLQVRTTMSPAPIIIEVGETSERAGQLMIDYEIGCLPVMLCETLVGLVTAEHLLTAPNALPEALCERLYEQRPRLVPQ